ncbi:MAG: Flp pilus assembly complex ATPase component TadA [Deltaproteobacteria bacterium]|nr:Flp pilus assembly complex ATPase component TadA [Deltaproteobacteria bacterium]
MLLSIQREGAPAHEVNIPGETAVLGKHADCEVVLDDPLVSRRHARLRLDAGRIVLEDLGSTNGTELAGQPVEGQRVVEPGQEIRIGPFAIFASLPEVTLVQHAPAPAVAAGSAVGAGISAADSVQPAPAPAASAPAAAPAPAVAAAPNVAMAGVDFGPLAPLMAADEVSEIMVNGPDEVFVERGGRLELTGACFSSADALGELIRTLATQGGRSIDERRPMVDARMRDGSRLNAILPPLALRGPCLTIRRFPRQRLSAADLVSVGALSEPMLAFLRLAIHGKLSLLVSGGTGSGKTTLLNALASFVGDDQRIITIEDAAELRLPQRHVLPLEARPPDPDGGGQVTIRELVRNALRMRPDRIVVGEVRGAEALDMLQAMNTGHEGSLSTVHANSPREALSRLETLVLFAGADLPPRAIREQILGAIRLLVHTARGDDGKRRVTSITELSGMEGEQFTLGEIFRYEPGAGGTGQFRATGYVPRCRDRLAERGFAADNAWFQPR